MRTVIKLYKEHSEAYKAFNKEMREAVGTFHFRLYNDILTYDSDRVKYVYASLENWVTTSLPNGENVEMYLMCEVDDEEYYMVAKDYHIYS